MNHVRAAARTGAVALFAMLLTNCAVAPRTGDFGRPKPSVVNDKLLPAAGVLAARARGEPASFGPMTDEEKRLRDLSFAILMPAGDRNVWERSLAELRRTRILPNHEPEFDAMAYTETLIERPYRSDTARYAQLIEDIGTDITRISPFFGTAARVMEMDAIREKSLDHATKLKPEEREQALERIAENRLLIGWVHRRFDERHRGYRLALERLVIATPAPAAVGAERTLHLLKERIAQIPLPGPEAAPVPVAVVVVSK